MVKVKTSVPMTIAFASKNKITGSFNGSSVVFNKKNGTEVVAEIISPSTPGKYLLSTPSSPIPLVIEVTSPVAPSKPVMAEKKGWLSWLTDIFH